MAVTRTLFTVHTTGVIIVLFLICVFLINGGITEEEIGSPLRVAQCRARCIKTFSDTVDSQKACLQDPDCYMCWENCQLLQSNFPVWGAICSKKGICFPGCQQACQFHLEKITQRAPVQVITHGEEVITLTGNTASWPRPGAAASDSAGPFVYVVMRRLPGRAWKQITQTLDLSTRIPAGPTAGTIRVLVVNKDGLVTIYSPIVKSGLSGAEAIIRSLGKDGLFGLGFPLTNAAGSSGQGKRINTEIMSVTTVDPLSMLDDGEEGTWNLREVSLIHQKVLVIAEIAWDAQQTSKSSPSRAVYFVTWEVDGGGLKGNLFTDSTCVTLSLWPDTIYHIQVELVTHNSQRTEQSEDLVLDTHRAVVVEFDTPMPPPEAAPAPAPTASTTPASIHGSSPHKVAVLKPRPAQLELVAGACAALVVFLAILVALTWRWRRQHHLLHLPHHAKLVQDDYLAATATPNLSTVYPPIVTLVGNQSITGVKSDCRQNYTRPSAATPSTSSSSSTGAVVAAIPNNSCNSLLGDEAATAVASTSHAPV